MLQAFNSALILQTLVSVYSNSASPPASLLLWIDMSYTLSALKD